MNWIEEWAKFETIENWVALGILVAILVFANAFIIGISLSNAKDKRKAKRNKGARK